MVTNKALILLTWLCILLAPIKSWAAVSASIDRTISNQDQTLNLTLRIDQSGARAPDLSALEKDFYIIGTNQSSRHIYTNGKSDSSTEWFINLIPQHSGRIVIPSFIIEGEQTQPITIQVKPSGASTDDDLQAIFLETEVDKKSIYVQEQLTYTLRILYSVQIEQATLPDPVLINASVKKIGENSFDKNIKGINYRVFERTYAIFPQQVGELTIPPVLFSAIQSSGRQSMLRLQPSGTPIRKMSKEQTVKVVAPPDSFQGETWLPAASVTLKETWSGNPRELHVGESITRIITSSAQNLLAAQLPPIVFEQIAGIKLYPDQGSLESTENNKGVYATRVDSTAIIPTREGELTLPAIRLRWWDTTSNRSRVAVIPETKLTIKPALEEPININTPHNVDHSQQQALSTETAVVSTAEDPRWKIIALILLGLWVVTLLFYWRLNRQLKNYRLPTRQPAKMETSASEKKAFKKLVQATRGTDLLATRKAVIAWARAHWPTATINSLQDIKTLSDHPSLDSELAQLDAMLYSTEAKQKNWDGDKLITVIKLIQQKKTSKTSPRRGLDPLYKIPD